jgi:hypothetical protein
MVKKSTVKNATKHYVTIRYRGLIHKLDEELKSKAINAYMGTFKREGFVEGTDKRYLTFRFGSKGTAKNFRRAADRIIKRCRG